MKVWTKTDTVAKRKVEERFYLLPFWGTPEAGRRIGAAARQPLQAWKERIHFGVAEDIGVAYAAELQLHEPAARLTHSTKYLRRHWRRYVERQPRQASLPRQQRLHIKVAEAIDPCGVAAGNVELAQLAGRKLMQARNIGGSKSDGVAEVEAQRAQLWQHREGTEHWRYGDF